MTTLYHGSHCHTELTIHDGICLTDERDVADNYGRVFEIEIDLGSLVVEECPGYDHDTNEAPADDDGYRAAAAARGVDVLVYEDEDVFGRQHTCYRLVSTRSFAAVCCE